MTTPGSGGSPLRIGGFALIGVGIVAGVIGLATAALGGDGGESTTAAPSSTTSIAPEPSPAIPTSSAAGSVPVPSFGPNGNIAAPTGSAAPGAGGAGAGVAGSGSGAGSGALAEGGPGATLKAPVRVYNNSFVTGLASRAADDFRNSGWQVDQVANYPRGVIPTSTVYYRPGTSEQAAADALAAQFGLRSEPRFAGLDEATPGLIVIVTDDYQRR